MSAKKSRRRRNKAEKQAAWGESKFHGRIVVTPPPPSDPIADTTEIVVAIRSIAFGDLPEFDGKSEIRLMMSVESGTPDGGAAGALKLELLRYVEDDSTLNIGDLVVFQGKVQRFLTIRCAIDELDAATAAKAAPVISALFGLLGSVVTGGTAKAVIGGLPALIGGLLAFNADDQILVLNHSLYTPSVVSGNDRTLRPGVYTFEKFSSEKDGEDKTAQVTIRVEVMRVAK